MPELLVDLHITPEELLKLYRGNARDVWARAEDGRRVRFPAGSLRRFVTRAGVRGRFRIRYDATGRLQGVARC